MISSARSAYISVENTPGNYCHRDQQHLTDSNNIFSITLLIFSSHQDTHELCCRCNGDHSQPSQKQCHLRIIKIGDDVWQKERKTEKGMISDSFTYYTNTNLTFAIFCADRSGISLTLTDSGRPKQAKQEGQRNCEAEIESITSSSVIVLVFHRSHPETESVKYSLAIFWMQQKRRKQRQIQRHCLPPCVVIYDMAPLTKERMKASVVRKVAAVAVS